MNFNCLLHPEIAATRHRGELNGRDNSGHQLLTQEEQQELNLSRGLAGTLIDTILETRLREDARNGVNREEIRRKKKQSAIEAINAGKKRYSAGLHATAQRYMLGPDVLDVQEEKKRQQDDKVSERLEKKLQEFRTLKSKVTAIREDLNKHTGEEMTVAQLKTMVTWYKYPGDLPIPTTRTLLLERLQATAGRHDPKEPELPTARR